MVTQLNAGDFAFVAYNADSEDDFAIVMLQTITASQTVYFTDDEWLGSAFNTNFPEGTLTWTTPASLAAGTIVTFSNVAQVSGSNTTVASVSHGSLDQTFGGGGYLSLSSAGDSILAYQGSLGNPARFVAGISADETGFAQGSDGGTLNGTGLVLGVSAIEIGNSTNTSPDGGAYNGTRDSAASFTDYAAIVNTLANWSIDSTGNGDAFLPFSSTAFTTGAADTTAPLLSTLSPTDGAVNVGVNSNLVLAFNETVALGTGIITIRNADDNSVFETIPVPSGNVSASGQSVTINPLGTFATASRYYVEVSSNAVQDDAGNPYAGFSGSQAFNFSTVLPAIGAAPVGLGAGSIAFVGLNSDSLADDMAIVALEDLDGSITPFQIFITDQSWMGASFDTSGDGTIIWTIDELIPAGTVINFSDIGPDYTSNSANFASTHGFISSDGAFSASSNGDILFAYVGSLESPSTFLAGVATDSLGFSQGGATLSGTGLTEGTTAANIGSIADGLDFVYSGDRSTAATFADYLDDINGASASNYTTLTSSGDGETLSPFTSTAFSESGPDLTPPGLVSVSPADETANVAVGANLSATFNEDVQIGTGTITIYSKNGDTAVATIDVTSSQVTVSGATVTINPTADLDPATSYYVEISSGAIEDLAGNDFTGIAGETDWNFSTATPALSVPSIGAGDIAFTGLNVDGGEDLAFVVLEDLNGASAPFQLFFTDNEWNGTSFATTKGTLIWTVTTDIAAGTVITFNDVRDSAGAGFEASVGLLQEDGAFDINSGGDVIFAYKGTLGTPAANGHLAAIATDELDFALNSGGLTNTGLVDGVTAVSLSDSSTSPDGAVYSGGRDTLTSFDSYASAINNAANWTVDLSDGEQLVPFSTTGFTLANSAPTLIGKPFNFIATEDTATQINLFGIAFGDADNDTLTVSLAATAGILTASASGDLTVTGTGTDTITLVGTAGVINTYLISSPIQYTGALNATGTGAANIVITADDGAGGQLQTTEIIRADIFAVNDAPTVAGAPTDLTFVENVTQGLDLSDVSFSEVDGESLTVTLTASSGTFSGLADGVVVGVTETLVDATTVRLGGSASAINTYLDIANFVSYTGALNLNGDNAATVTISAVDPLFTPLATSPVVNIDITSVNEAPVITGVPATVAAFEDTASGMNLSAMQFSDSDGDVITVTLTASAGIITAVGVPGVTVMGSETSAITFAGTGVSLNTYFTSSAARIFYTGPANAFGDGLATVTVSAVDSNAAPLASNPEISINVAATNDAPTVTGVPSEVTVVEDTPTNINLAAVQFADIDGDSTITVTLLASGGTLSLATPGLGLTVDGNNSSSVTLTGAISLVNAYLDTTTNVSYEGAPNLQGDSAETLTLSAVDAGGAALVSNPQIDINITNVNDAPVISGVPVGATVTEDSYSILDLSTVVLGDVDGDVLTVTLSVTAGSLYLSANADVTVAGVGTTLLTVTGLAADITSLIDDGVGYIGAVNANGDSAAVLTVTARDPSNAMLLINPEIEIDITPVDDRVVVAGVPSELTVLEDTVSDLDLSSIVLTDVDSLGPIDVILKADTGTITAGSLGGVTVQGSGTSDVTLTGTLVALNAYLADITNIDYLGLLDLAGDGAARIDVFTNEGAADVAEDSITLNITSVRDEFPGGGMADIQIGTDGNDDFLGSGGADTIDGRSGRDWIYYGDSIDGVQIDLKDGTATGGLAEGDIISNIENLSGSKFADELFGDSGANSLKGGKGGDTILGRAGADIINGGKGADTLSGGRGNDTLSYGGSGQGVTVNLATNTVSGGQADGDTIQGFENIAGTIAVDTLTGDAGNNLIRGGGSGDILDGGLGFDTLNYRGSDAFVSVNLATGAATGGHAQGDMFMNFDAVIGSKFDDVLTGNDAANVLRGSAGNDIIDGGLGDDTLVGNAGNDTFMFNAGNDRIKGGTGDDIAIFDGNQADFMMSFNILDGSIAVLETATGDIDVLADIELLRFDDIDISSNDLLP